MGIRTLIGAMVLFAAGTSEAGHKLFVLRAESSTDWPTRTHVEKSVVGLARNVDRGVSRGDMSFSDLALSVGCTKDLDGCKNAVVEALMVDELVVITIVPSGDDKVKVTVQRASKKGIREATGVVDKADPVDGVVTAIGPLFGAKKLIGERPAANPLPAKTKATMTLGTAEVDNEQPPALAAKPAPEPPKIATEPARPAPEIKPAPELKPAPRTEPAATAPATVTAAPDNIVETDRPRRTLYIGGMVAGGLSTIVGVVLWEKARSLEADARAAPNRTGAEIASLRDLESSGDHYALAGNVAFFSGLALAGVSGYLFWRSGETHVAPMGVDHGGGVAVSFEVP